MFLDQTDYVVPPACPWGFHPIEHVLQNSKRRHSWIICIRCSDHLVRVSSCHPGRKLISAACIHDLILSVQYPRAHGEGWNVDRLLNQESCLEAQIPAHPDSPVQCVHLCWRGTNPPVDLALYIQSSVQNPVIRWTLDLVWKVDWRKGRSEWDKILMKAETTTAEVCWYQQPCPFRRRYLR